MNKLETLKTWVQESNRIVFFGGAGVSTESGIPDFRSVDGLYHQKFDYPPETIISHSFYERNPEYFFRFYREKMLPLGFEPNITHRILAKWEQEGKLLAVVTQNIDGLHQKAGSKKVYELHGSVLRNYCTRCGKFYSAEFVKNAPGIPRCSCGGIVKPDVVLYEESLNEKTIAGSVKAIRSADILIVAGTSLTVYPAAGLINYYRGSRLVLINRDETPYDDRADLVLHESLGDVFSNSHENQGGSTASSLKFYVFLSHSAGFPLGIHPEHGRPQQNAYRHDTGDGGGVHAPVGKHIHLAPHGEVHGVIHPRAGNQRERGHQQIGNGGIFADSCHNFGV